MRDGTVDLAAPGSPVLRLDALTADGDVSSDAVAVTVAAHAEQWRNARAQARIDPHSLAASLELEIEALDAAPALEREDVAERLAAAAPDANRDGFPYSLLEIDASLAAGSVVIERSLLEGPVLNIAAQGEIRLADGRVALTGVALPIVTAIARKLPVLGNLIGDPIIGIPFSVSGDVGNPQVQRVGATAVTGALVRTLQSVVSLPVQLLGGSATAGESPARDPP